VAFLHAGVFEFVGTFDEAAHGAHPILSDFFRSCGFPAGTQTASIAASAVAALSRADARENSSGIPGEDAP
jgi:hypothetical protein